MIYSAADVLTSTARAFEGRKGGRLTDASEMFDRAAREPHRRPPGRSRQAGELRSISRLIAVMGRLTGNDDTIAALEMVLTMSMFADNLADLREAQQRLHQARAARQAAERLRTIAHSTATGVGVHPTTTASTATPLADDKARSPNKRTA
ncbi:hypothetical protein K1W54_22240 [Micromonospora sp. CPCC 205371]|nr:hypothetical protein [Micromonospora sp. CPCC 205371]